MRDALHLLLIEDDPADAALAVRALSRAGFDVSAERVETADETRRILAAGGIDLVIADYTLPTFTGVEALGILAELRLDTPLVIVSGTIDAPTALAAMRAGAKDFVVKDELDRLPQVVRRELEEARNRSRRVQAERERDEALQELRTERDVLGAVMERSNAVLAYLDPELRYVALNEAYAALVGGRRDEMLGRSAQGFVAQETWGALEQVRGSGEPVRFETMPLEPDGRRRYWNWSVVPVVERGSVAGYVVSGIDSTEEVRARRLADAAAEISNMLALSGEPWNVLDRVLDSAVHALEGQTAVVVQRAEGGWRTARAWPLPVETFGAFHADDAAPTLTRVLQSRESHLVPDTESGESVNVEVARRVGYRAYATFPLVARNAVVGALTFFFEHPRESFDRGELGFMRRVAFSLSFADENARLAGKEQRAHRLADALNTVNELLLSTLSTDEILERVLGTACVAADADSGIILQPDAGAWVVRQLYGVPEQLRDTRFEPSDVRSVLQAVESGGPLMVEDALANPLTNRESASHHGIASYMVLPVFLEGEVVASMSLSYAHRRAFGEEDARFAERLSTALSLALRNARLYEAEHGVAETLQTALLAMPADVPGVRLAHAYHSAAQTARVGGDFYDVFELEHGLLAIVIGDVSGKGLEAAALTSLLKSSLRAHALERGMSPAAVVQRTSEIVLHETRMETFVTAFFAILDRRDGRLVYCNAGHGDVAVVRQGGEVLALEPNSPLVGAFQGVEFEQADTRLDVGDVLFLFTDGLTEARRDGELFGEERLFAALRRLPGRGPAEVVDDMLGEVLAFTGGKLSDDLALLAVARAEPLELGAFQTKLL